MNAASVTVHSFDTLPIGEKARTPGRTLTETDLIMYAMMVTDWHPIHTDETFAKTTKLGRRVLHGTFGLGIAFGVSTHLLEITNPVIGALGIREWFYRAPLFIGDTVCTEVEILEKRKTSDGRRGVIARKLRLINQDGTVVQEGIGDMMVLLTS